MSFKKLALLIAALTVTATAAHAAPMTFGIGAGMASPTGDFGDVANMGWDANVYGDMWIKPNMAIGVDIDGSFYGGSDDYTDLISSPSYPDPNFSASMIGFLAHGKMAFARENSKMQPWITAGLGMYNVGVKLEDSDPIANFDDSESDFGFNFGGGLDWATSPTMKFGLDAKYHMVQTEGDATNFFTVGAHLSFMTGQ